MKSQMKLFRKIIAILAIPSSFVIGQSKVATTAAQFLGISAGAQALAMGSAGVAQITDASSIYWNPGAFVQVDRSEFQFVNTPWLAGTQYRWFGIMLNIDHENAFGLSLTQLDYGDEEVTTVELPEGTNQKWSASDLAIAVSYCRKLTDRFSIGGSVKYVSQSIWNESASTVAFDVGLLFVTGFSDMRLGMSMSNFGGELQLDGRDLLTKVDVDPGNPGGNKTLMGKMKTESWPIPLFFRVGAALDIVKNSTMSATVAVDAVRPNDSKEAINLGAEICWMELLSLRAGYKGISFESKEEYFGKETQQEGLTFGAGLRYQVEGIGMFQVNYAYTDFGYFGYLNTLGIGFSF
jgi:hypothetical protein